MLLMLDNYDSFTYNLVQYFGELGADVRTHRNDQITIAEIEALQPERICISPGPCTPAQAGISMDVIRHFAGKLPILGVCLGHQAIGAAFGGEVVRARELMHGKVSEITHQGSDVFAGLPTPFTVTRYHSLAVARDSLPDCLEVTAETADGEIMGLRHTTLPIYGVQFHPESILSEHGHDLLKNFCILKPEFMTISTSEALTRCIEHREIFHDEMLHLMRQLMRGEIPAATAAALLMGLRVKKETIGEITAAAQAMREFALPVPVSNPDELLDMCGTGGDGSNTFNISTAAMFVAAAAGVKIAKHGNRSASSSSGSADVLEALGISLTMTPEQVAESIESTGIGFMFAPAHHGAMKNVAAVRKELGVRTIFNILGPLTNPANAANQLMGVFHPDLVGIQVRVLERLGAKHVLIVHGRDGMDEGSLGAATMVGELKDGHITEYEIHPEDFGVAMVSNRGIKVNNREESAALIMEALDNVEGPARDIVALNAGLAIYTGNKAASIQEGLTMAYECLRSGAARAKLEELRSYTKKITV